MPLLTGACQACEGVFGEGQHSSAAWLCDAALTEGVELHYYPKGHCLEVIHPVPLLPHPALSVSFSYALYEIRLLYPH